MNVCYIICCETNRDKAGNMERTSPIRTGGAPTPAVLLATRRSSAASTRKASCQVTAFRFWPPSVAEKNWTLGAMRPELFLRRLPVPFRTELLRRMELRFRSEFCCDSSLFWSVWIRMDGFSSSSLALQRGVATCGGGGVGQEVLFHDIKLLNHNYKLTPG